MMIFNLIVLAALLLLVVYVTFKEAEWNNLKEWIICVSTILILFTSVVFQLITISKS